MSDQAQHFGKYRILTKLGRGGFATVYRARDITLERDVALKILHPELLSDRGFVQRFHQEARTLAALRHPHIITIFEVGEAEKRLFIAMELGHGPSLALAIADRQRIPWEEMLALLKPICEALDYAHGQGVVHRDLKPANILLDTERTSLLTDFGFARLMGESSVSLSMSRGIVGTPGYIAPEVWGENSAAAPVDVYALGCIVYEMLVGDVLFPGQTPLQVLHAHDRGPQLPAAWPEGVPPGIEAVLGKALARTPAARYQSAGALWYALHDLGSQARVVQAAAESAGVAAEWRAATEAAITAGEWSAARMALGRWLAIAPNDPMALAAQAKLKRLTAGPTAGASGQATPAAADELLSALLQTSAAQRPTRSPPVAAPPASVQRVARRRSVSRWAWALGGLAALVLAIGGAVAGGIVGGGSPPTPGAPPVVSPMPSADATSTAAAPTDTATPTPTGTATPTPTDTPTVTSTSEPPPTEPPPTEPPPPPTEPPPPAVLFTTDSFRVGEGDKNAAITLALSRRATGPVMVTVSMADGTAKAGQDYIAAGGTLAFSPGEIEKTFVVPILDDDLDEDDETVRLALSDPVGATLGPRATASLTIEDNDTSPTVQFTLSSYSVDEGGAATIFVTLSSKSAKTVTVNYTTSDGTAAAPGDYATKQETLSFNPGVVRTSFEVQTVNDKQPESNETITLRLNNPANAKLGSRDSATISIRDNDLIVAPSERARVTVTFTKIDVHNDADPKDAGDIWLNFTVNGKTARWPGSGTGRVTDGGSYSINTSIMVELSVDDTLDITVEGTEDDGTNGTDDMGAIHIRDHRSGWGGGGSTSRRSSCPVGCYTIYYTVKIVYLK